MQTRRPRLTTFSPRSGALTFDRRDADAEAASPPRFSPRSGALTFDRREAGAWASTPRQHAWTPRSDRQAAAGEPLPVTARLDGKIRFSGSRRDRGDERHA